MTISSASPELIGKDDLVLVTGAGGFIGRRVVANLLGRGFTRVRCLARTSGGKEALSELIGDHQDCEIVFGNLLNREDCRRAVDGIKVIYHLAAGRGEKSFSDAFLNSVVTTRNLLAASVDSGVLVRFVNVSSFTVYTDRGQLLTEDAAVETQPHLRGEAYCFAKSRQEAIVNEYAAAHGLPCVTLRPGYVYGPGNEAISSRVGIGTFGLFLHLGGNNPVPLSYVDNCAEAIVLAGLVPGIDGEVFNVIDDDLPTSREFLRLYKANVRSFPSLSLPRPISYLLCDWWERYADWSQGQLPAAFNRRMWKAYWEKGTFSNAKIKTGLGWKQLVLTNEALHRYFESCKGKANHA